MDADEDRVREAVCKLDPLLERQAVVVGRVISTLKPARCSSRARGQRHIEGELLLGAPLICRAVIRAAVAGIEHDRLHFLRILDPARTQDRLDDFADIHGGDQVAFRAAREREIGEETHAIDVDLARAGLRADAAALAAQRDGAVGVAVIRRSR